MRRPDRCKSSIAGIPGRVTVPAKSTFQQPIKKAKIHFTEQWKTAQAECEATVKAIAQQCRDQNRKFRDIEFDLELDTENCLYGLNPPPQKTDGPIGVRRVTQIFEKPEFFIDGAGANDVVQGALGNCWFLSALAAMSASKGLIEEFCVKGQRDEVVGVYGFVFFRNMIPVTVIIDDLLFVSIPKFAELSDEERKLCHNDEEWFNRDRRRGGRTLYFSRSWTENETWVPLFEKAFAKLHGDYASLCSGATGEAIEDITGGVSFLIPTKDILDPDQFWKEELAKVNKYRLFGCSTVGPNPSRTRGKGDVKMQGITGEHAYSVIRAAEYNNKRFVVVRNPWAGSEWTGPWSDGSKEWTLDWLPALGKDYLDHKFGEDGEFVMEYRDFLEKWEFVDRTLLFDETWVMSSQWLKVTTRSTPTPWSYGDVSFTISLNDQSETIIVLSQLDSRYYIGITGQYEWSFDFVLYKKGGENAIASSLHSRFCARSVNLEINLKKGEYVVHVRLDRYLRDYDDNSEHWDDRKVSRVLVERAKSRSLASNFRTDQRSSYLPVPLKEFAGQDIGELEHKARDAAKEMRKRNEALESAKLTADGPVVTVVQEAACSLPAEEPTIIEGQPVAEESPLFEKIGSEGEPESWNGAEEPAAPTDFVNDDNDSVYLGLHVYTQNTRSEVHGQLRHEMGVGFDGLAVTGLVEMHAA